MLVAALISLLFIALVYMLIGSINVSTLSSSTGLGAAISQIDGLQ